MNTTRIIKNWTRMLLLGLALTQGGQLAHAATYRVGDLVTNFTFIARRQFTRPDGTVAPAGSTVRLSDFTGRIVFLEWFAVWCPYCVAAAPQVKTGIVDWYSTRGGNPSGIPVLHIAVNQEAASFYQSQTDSFITQQGFNPVVNDYSTASTNTVRFMFQSAGQPIFVVINGVTNSPSHQPWQLLVNHLGYGDTDFNQELARFRAIIDGVQAPVLAPQLGTPHFVGSTVEFILQSQAGTSYRVQGSSNLVDWTTLATISATNTPTVFRDTNAPASRRFYRTVTP